MRDFMSGFKTEVCGWTRHEDSGTGDSRSRTRITMTTLQTVHAHHE